MTTNRELYLRSMERKKAHEEAVALIMRLAKVSQDEAGQKLRAEIIALAARLETLE